MKKSLSIFAVLATAALARAAAPTVTADDLRRQMLLGGKLLIVDVRGAGDFAAGHIQGARNVPSAQITQAELPRDAAIVVYCGEYPCPLTTGAADALLSAGYPKVAILEGGIGAWMQKGYPISKGIIAKKASAFKVVGADEASKSIAAGELVPLDVRPAQEFSAGHLPGAKNMPLEALNPAAAQAFGKTLLVYDRKSERSRKAVKQLSAVGVSVVELSGGLPGWVKNKLPLEMK